MVNHAAPDPAPPSTPPGGVVSPIITFTSCLLGIRRHPDRLAALWPLIRATWRPDQFTDIIERLTGETVVFCHHCGEPAWLLDAYQTADDLKVCERCRDSHYAYCYHCDQLHRWTQRVNDNEICPSCIDANYQWCDQCDAYFHFEANHSHDCDCEARYLNFQFPANGAGTLRNDERVTVTLPAGFIDDCGIDAIVGLLHDHVPSGSVARELDQRWQTPNGNFTRRLSRLLFQRSGVKLPASVLSEVGNLARQHSSDTSTWHVEFTRNLNQPAVSFYHEDSCWWSTHASSRCALKNCGGMALRSYRNMDVPSSHPSGRAWVIPLTAVLRPTAATETPAYVIFNGYGNLAGLVAVRLLAHLTSKTYRKILFTSDPMYVNGDCGFLVADQATCDITREILFSVAEHSAEVAA